MGSKMENFRIFVSKHPLLREEVRKSFNVESRMVEKVIEHYKFQPDKLKLIELYFLRGKTIVNTCLEVGICRRTFFRWTEEILELALIENIQRQDLNALEEKTQKRLLNLVKSIYKNTLEVKEIQIDRYKQDLKAVKIQIFIHFLL